LSGPGLGGRSGSRAIGAFDIDPLSRQEVGSGISYFAACGMTPFDLFALLRHATNCNRAGDGATSGE
jgi:hypothetical protein